MPPRNLRRAASNLTMVVLLVGVIALTAAGTYTAMSLSNGAMSPIFLATGTTTVTAGNNGNFTSDPYATTTTTNYINSTITTVIVTIVTTSSGGNSTTITTTIITTTVRGHPTVTKTVTTTCQLLC